VAALMRENAEKMQCIRVVWLNSQYPSVEPLGVIEPPILVVPLALRHKPGYVRHRI
jgi:hypothetical protein